MSTAVGRSLPAVSYVRRTVERLSSATARDGSELAVWEYVHLIALLEEVVLRGHDECVREAADRLCAAYELPPQSAIENA